MLFPPDQAPPPSNGRRRCSPTGARPGPGSSDANGSGLARRGSSAPDCAHRPVADGAPRTALLPVTSAAAPGPPVDRGGWTCGGGVGTGRRRVGAAAGSLVSTPRRSLDSEQATAARDAAQDVFVALDRAQKLGAARVLAFARLDAGPEGARLKAAWAPVAAAADEAAARFLATLDRYPVVEHAAAQDLRSAAGAYTAARQALTAVTERVESFLRSHDQLLQRVERAYATLGPATASAASAVAGARASAAATRAAGLDSAELAHALGSLDDAAGLLAQGATVHGLAETLRLAGAATAAAGTVDAVVAALARDRDTAAAALGSLPTGSRRSPPS